MADLSKMSPEFQAAAETAKGLDMQQYPKEDRLLLYGLKQQAIFGDNKEKRPGMMDVKGRTMHDAWDAQKGKPQAAASTEFVAHIKKLVTAAPK